MFSTVVIYGRDYKAIVPDKKLQEVPVGAKVYAIRGCGHVMAVFVLGRRCIGYIDIHDFGFNSVTEFLTIPI